MVLRSNLEADTQAHFNRVTGLAAVGSLVIANLVTGCIPKRSCEFTRTCPPDGGDAATEVTSAELPASSSANSGGSVGDASAQPVDAATTSEAGVDAGAATAPIIACVRSTDCTPDLPFCEDSAKVCTGCRADRDCKNDDAPWCLLDSAEPQNNHCAQCLTTENCADGVCREHACVVCNTDTNEGCGGSTPLCASIDGAPTCVGCEVDDDCAENPDRPTCSNNVCKACSAENPSHCPAQTPVCVEEATSARCVACSDSSHCQLLDDGANAVCVEEQCTTCVLGTGQGCPTTKPFCAAVVPEPGDAGLSYLTPSQSQTPTANQYLEYEHVCIECPNNKACGGSLPGCFEGQCVQCTEDAHCKGASASVCDTSTHTCIGCQALGDCSHLANTKACDIEHGICVQCTAAEDTCGEKACQTVPGDGQYTCSMSNKGQTSPCFECVGDSACTAGSNCVHEIYESTDGGWRCLKHEPTLGSGDTCASLKVFDVPVAGTSIEGVAGPYCHPRLTSCQGYRHHGDGPVIGANGQGGCLTDEDCGLPGVDDGYCVSISATANRCTYGCGSAQDCAVPLNCALVTSVDGNDAQVCSM